MEIEFHPFLNSALDIDGFSASCSDSFTVEGKPQVKYKGKGQPRTSHEGPERE
jgi:hypothetical protein